MSIPNRWARYNGRCGDGFQPVEGLGSDRAGIKVTALMKRGTSEVQSITPRRPVIGVMGGSKVNRRALEAASELGRLIARRGWILLNGGRNKGIMAASAQGARDAGGTVIGILPDTTAAKASPNLDYVILTGMGDARNVINVLSSDLVIACTGGLGTLSEVMLALKHDKKVILLGLDPGPELDRYRKTGLLREAATPADAVEQAAALLAKHPFQP